MRLDNAVLAEESIVLVVAAQKYPEHAFRIGEEIACDEVMLRVLVCDLLDAVCGELEDARIGVGHKDRRMRGHDELRAFGYQVMNPGEHRQLALGRERRLGFVEDVQTLSAEALSHQGEKGFAMRLFVQRAPAESIDDARASHWLGVEILDLRRHIEEALRTKEETVLRAPDASGDTQEGVKFRVRRARAEVEVAAAALGIEPERDRDRLKQRRLPRAVLAHQDSHLRMKIDLFERPDGRQRKRIAIKGIDLVALKGNPRDELTCDHGVEVCRWGRWLEFGMRRKTSGLLSFYPTAQDACVTLLVPARGRAFGQRPRGDREMVLRPPP